LSDEPQITGGQEGVQCGRDVEAEGLAVD
jgi:hypothetical protein